jgi:hypothetical protein
METQEAWAQFLNTTILPARLEQVSALHQYYRDNKETIVEGIVSLLDEVCQEAVFKQGYNTLQACTQIRFSLLRTSLLEGKLEYVVEALDESSSDFYQVTRFKYHADWLYPYYERWNQFCHSELKRYMGVLKPWFYELWQSKELFSFLTYAIHAIRYATSKFEELPSFQALQLGEEFELIVGEYGDILLGESVYCCTSNQRTEKDVLHWLDAQLPHSYGYGHLANLDLSGLDCGGITMNYARLHQINLTNSTWSYASLIGNRFHACEAVGIDFTASLLFDADFSNSVLIGANFDEVIAPLDALNEEDAVYFGIYPVSFMNADLTNASFQDATIAADFRGANLDGVNFQGADMTGSLMLRQDEMRVNLTPAQRLVMRWS